MRHCIATNQCPSDFDLGYLECSSVEACAREIAKGRQCSVREVDLRDLFTLLRMKYPDMHPASLNNFRALASRDPSCAAFPILSLLQKVNRIGSPRSHRRQLFPLRASHLEEWYSL